MRTSLVLAVALATVALAAPAQAASTRYASPNGSGSAPCTSPTTPCNLPTAASSAVSGDTLSVAAGTYQLTQILNLTNLNIVGGRSFLLPRPRILAPAGQIALAVHGGSVRNLQFEGTSGTNWVFDAADAVVESTVVLASGSQNDGMVIRGNTRVGDSIASATGNAAAGVLGADGAFHLRNVTAYSATSAAVLIRANTKPTQGNLVNTIAMGVVDVEALGTASFHSDITTRRSNFDTQSASSGSITSTAQQTTPPALVNPGAGDFHQTDASVTRNAGDPNDFSFFESDGDPDYDSRVVGPAPDIGADEWTPAPTVVTGQTTLIGATVATVNGTVNPNGGATSWYFQWGPTAAYGNPSGLALLFAGADAGRGASPVAVSRKLTGLSPSTTYHYRLHAANHEGGANGADATFTTGPPGTPDPGGSAPPPGQPGAALLVLSRVSVKPARFRVAAGRTALTARSRVIPRGTTFRWTLTEPATVKIAIRRKLPGRRKGKRCVRPTRALRHARRCTRLVTKGTFTRKGKLGANSMRFSGRIGRRKLAPGRYAAVLSARDVAGNRAKPVTLAFTVVGG